MSDLRIGQRCRLVNVHPVWRECEGDEVTILGLPGCNHNHPRGYEITRPAHFPSSEHRDGFYASRENLRPLTDPGADAFMERIRKLGREPIIEVEKVTR